MTPTTTDDPTKTAHDLTRKLVLIKRKAAHQAEGKLAAAYREIMALWDKQRAEGVPFTERLKGLSNVFRDLWPQGRTWHYLCDDCNDVGLKITDCPGNSTCGRSKAHLPHDFGTPCWCAKGERFKIPVKAASDYAQAGRTTKPTRIGR